MDYIEKLSLLPPHMRGAMQRYIENGIAPGDFLTAVLRNDLMGALGKADDENRHSLHSYGVYLYSYAPAGCYGSIERVNAWVSEGGLGVREVA
jgi:flagellar capping protein FliD